MHKTENKEYVMTQLEVGEKLFINPKTVLAVEKRAIEKLRKLMEERGIKSEDYLED
jgi:DNA-directed RNA polymerase specialized sigma subunit